MITVYGDQDAQGRLWERSLPPCCRAVRRWGEQGAAEEALGLSTGCGDFARMSTYEVQRYAGYFYNRQKP